MLADRIRSFEKTGQMLNNTPAQYKKEFEWLKEVDSLALANAQLNLNQAFQNHFRDKTFGFPNFKGRKNSTRSYTTNCVNNNIRLKKGSIVLPKLKAVKIRQHREIPAGYTLKSVTVSQVPTGAYYVSMLYAYESQIEAVKPVTFIGLDYSMTQLYVPSEGEPAQYPRYYRQSLEKLKREQRKLSHCQKRSKNRNKQRLKVARIHEKVANQRKDFLHKQSRQITNAADVVCIEDLNMKGLSQALNFGKSVSDNAFGTFVTLLDYKLREQGKQLVKIDKWFPSSKKCSCCGAVKKELSLSKRTYRCERCGAVIDRDYNASINIRNEGMRLVLTWMCSETVGHTGLAR